MTRSKVRYQRTKRFLARILCARSVDRFLQGWFHGKMPYSVVGPRIRVGGDSWVAHSIAGFLGAFGKVRK